MFTALVLALAIAPPQRWATDDAGALAAQDLAQLDARLEAYQQRTGHQLVVYVGKTLGQQPIEDWAAKTFGQWQVGRKGLDDGAALFVFVDDRTARIEVGYGLESSLTDAASARILRDVFAPKMASGDTAGALNATVEAMARTIGGEARAPPEVAVAQQRHAKWFVLAVGLIAFLGLAIWNPGFAWLLLMAFVNRGRGGGLWGGGGRGGFSGGGGRSGGAGATGHW